jgi:hypothetical protein
VETEFIAAPEVLERFVVLFGLGTSGLALTAYVPDYSEGRPDDRHRTQHEDAVQNSHRGEDNKTKQIAEAERPRGATLSSVSAVLV